MMLWYIILDTNKIIQAAHILSDDPTNELRDAGGEGARERGRQTLGRDAERGVAGYSVQPRPVLLFTPPTPPFFLSSCLEFFIELRTKTVIQT